MLSSVRFPVGLAFVLLLAGCPHPTPTPTLPMIPAGDAEKLALPAPDPARWLGRPLTAADTADKVTLLEVWTFACVHCRASHPWVASLQRRHPGLVVLAVHTPQTARERDPQAVAAYAAREHVTWPVYIDGDGRFFEAVRAEGWPTFLLLDKAGRVRVKTLGRAEPNSPHARALDNAIRDLQDEP